MTRVQAAPSAPMGAGGGYAGVAAEVTMRVGRWAMLAFGVLLSLAITAVMSWLFYAEVRGPMLVTGLVCAVLVDLAISRITLSYRRALKEANRSLEQRVAERTAELQTAYAQLEGASQQRLELLHRMAVLDRQATAGALAAGVCHEIKNPLGSLLGNLELAREVEGDPEELRRCVEDALLAARQVADVARDLARLARPMDDPAEPTDLVEVVDTARRLSAEELRAIERVDVELPEDLPQVLASRSRLAQVLINLLLNAAKATDPERPNVIRIQATADEATVRLAVSDTGVGVPDDVRPHLFDAFFTTREGRGGTGLGLYVCRQIVEQVGGRIGVDSTPGEGTTFWVVLPRVRPTEAATEAAVTP